MIVPCNVRKRPGWSPFAVCLSILLPVAGAGARAALRSKAKSRRSSVSRSS